ncbi:hypothetical protein L6452_05430 [Arctium lappa]|uniref:Uncharacterized protein n=1 Tax=Arctium lappa TaxID=4217 RepID=A0ACB9EHG1_ARCLA|nr:hypothetical protein L6452_05430 [Arctium lappa]
MERMLTLNAFLFPTLFQHQNLTILLVTSFSLSAANNNKKEKKERPVNIINKPSFVCFYRKIESIIVANNNKLGKRVYGNAKNRRKEGKNRLRSKPFQIINRFSFNPRGNSVSKVQTKINCRSM